jgi:hypothetical protein
MLEPPRTPQSSGFRRLVVMIAIVAVAGTAAVLYRDGTRRAARPVPPRIVADDPESDVDRALRLAAIDSTKKNEWVDELPDVDLAALGPGRAEVFLRFANARRCTCGCGFTLAACRRFDSTCEVSGPLVAALYDSVAKGLLADARGLRERPGVTDP